MLSRIARDLQRTAKGVRNMESVDHLSFLSLTADSQEKRQSESVRKCQVSELVTRKQEGKGKNRETQESV